MTLNKKLQEGYRGKTVLVTGHTGFKGSWLCEWLLMLGARVVGIALPPNTTPSLFEQLKLADRLEHHIQDIRDREALKNIVLQARPDYVFHLAAQPLVRLSYDEPVETYATNVMGTVHVLDALRPLNESYQHNDKYCATVFVTTDKCYENQEWMYGYREADKLGGYDPYSSSKAAAELAIASWRKSFFNPGASKNLTYVGIASARAGNVIGGGDWALDRIVPDCIRHLEYSESIPVRNPASTRPWQHVLDPLSGYLHLALNQRAALSAANSTGLRQYCSAFNFGPALASNRSVRGLVEEVLKHWPGHWSDQSEANSRHEADKLNLVWDKAFHLLNWQPRWAFSKAVARTTQWYQQQVQSGADPLMLSRSDIEHYGE